MLLIKLGGESLLGQREYCSFQNFSAIVQYWSTPCCCTEVGQWGASDELTVLYYRNTLYGCHGTESRVSHVPPSCAVSEASMKFSFGMRFVFRVLSCGLCDPHQHSRGKVCFHRHHYNSTTVAISSGICASQEAMLDPFYTTYGASRF